MVATQNASTERAFAQEFLHLVPVANLIMRYYVVITLLIIVAVVMLQVLVSLHFLCRRSTNEIDLRVI